MESTIPVNISVIFSSGANVGRFFGHNFSEILGFYRQKPIKSKKSLKTWFKESTHI
jgi:hypothetical protein